MLSAIGRHLRNHITFFPADDAIIFNSSPLSVNQADFIPVISADAGKTLAFVDGGQADILTAGNFCLSFIRVAAVFFQGEMKKGNRIPEFFLLTTSKYQGDMLTYESIIFPRKGGKIITGKELAISALDPTLRIGLEAAPLTSVSAMARRFAELALASSLSADFIILDGTLQPTYKGEENYISKLSSSTSALAKTSSLTTASGNSPVVLLNKIAGPGCWSYPVKDKTNFVKLHPDARHVFRFEGNADVLPHLPAHCQDALFLGYPYGLILADKLARISNEEKKSLRMNLLLRKENKEIAEYLNATNAHEILDAIG